MPGAHTAGAHAVGGGEEGLEGSQAMGRAL